MANDNSFFDGLGKIIGLAIAGIIWGYWQPELMVEPAQPWYWAWFTGGIMGSIAPFSWIMSFFTDCPVKLHDQGLCYGFFWWCGIIGTIMGLLTILLKVLSLFKK